MPDTSAQLDPRRLSRVQQRLARLQERRTLLVSQQARKTRELEAAQETLALAPAVTGALDQLSRQLFGEVVGLIETKLTLALQEVLDQPISLKVERRFSRGSASLQFSIERDGHREDIREGQGGSVANVLSVGLRLFALTTLPEKEHRRFLVLDEQDCWLKPELVPRLVKIVQSAGKALGFQTLMISHHAPDLFVDAADTIYEFIPQQDGSVRVRKKIIESPERD